MSVFDIDIFDYSTDLLLEVELSIYPNNNGTVIRTWISDDGFIWILFKNNTINTYEF